MSEFTAEEFRALLSYDPITGIFRWQACAMKRMPVGAIAGKTAHNGYRTIKIRGRTYASHRLAWLFVHNRWPSIVDHIDGVRTNNAIANLRIATPSQNGANTRLSVRNTSGYRGVGYNKKRANKRWSATIMVNRTLHRLGHFDTAEEAHAVYCAAAVKHFGEFARAA